MIGVGNGFTENVYDNNALISDGKHSFLLDCGITAWKSLYTLGILRESIESIFVSHLHFDHSGGLESAALYSKYISKCRHKLFVPSNLKESLWEHYLKGSLLNTQNNALELEDYFEVVAPKEEEEFTIFEGLKGRWIRTHHIEGKFSCGLLLNDKLFYTSDMVCNESLLSRLLKDGVHIVFHDCSFENRTTHAHFDDILTYGEDIKKTLHLMHHGIENPSTLPVSTNMKFLFQYDSITF